MNELRTRRDEHLTNEDGGLLLTQGKVEDYLSFVEGDESEIPPFPDFWTSAKWVNVVRPMITDDFAGRLLVLDFWTFCCINCMHIMPVRWGHRRWRCNLFKFSRYSLFSTLNFFAGFG